jgi:lipoprotein-anchoring transpeptidase ErfK/SrfK
MPSARPFARLLSISFLIVLLVLTALTGTGTAAPPGADAPATRPRVVARAATDLAVYAHKGDPTPVMSLPATTSFGTGRALLVTKRKARWLEVLLPTRPNGSKGWVHTADVELRPVHDDLVVDLTARTLTWRRDGAVILTTTIAVGAPETPTPTGRFSVTDLLDTPDDEGYGPFAVGVSGHSDQLTDFGGGDGQIGVHGTSDPSSIGQAVSHGCVRVPNDVIARLATSLPLGTPVVIR